MAEYLSLALSSFLSIDVFLGLLVGVVGGMIIGIIPGLGPSVGIALLLPISFSMSPTAALVMMTAMYTTGVYGGSITAVLCHTPGTAASAATTQDGYEMTKKGRGMEAVSVVTIASVVGGIIGAICLILFAPHSEESVRCSPALSISSLPASVFSSLPDSQEITRQKESSPLC